MIGALKKIKQNEQLTLGEYGCFRNGNQERSHPGGGHLTDMNDKKRQSRNLCIQVYSLTGDRGTKV